MNYNDHLPPETHAQAQALARAYGPLAPPPFPPRYLTFGGVECKLERVQIGNLAAWRQRHGVEYWGTSFVEGVGFVHVYWPIGEEEQA